MQHVATKCGNRSCTASEQRGKNKKLRTTDGGGLLDADEQGDHGEAADALDARLEPHSSYKQLAPPA